ncbi:MAG: hypothetical protein BroJett009_24160 [Armatimonadota bacterium]|nr:MAG: hypothetical protein BroJett009_24160 [Armatimonadota bacterium]
MITALTILAHTITRAETAKNSERERPNLINPHLLIPVPHTAMPTAIMGRLPTQSQPRGWSATFAAGSSLPCS